MFLLVCLHIMLNAFDQCRGVQPGGSGGKCLHFRAVGIFFHSRGDFFSLGGCVYSVKVRL